MTQEASLYTRLGYGQLDMTEGSWVASDDVAGFTNVRYPQRDQKYYARQLLRLLGKRFADEEARLIWQEIEIYRDELTRLYGPAEGAVGSLPLEQAAQRWYEQQGRRFEKAWWLGAPLQLQFAREGHERVRGRWVRWFHPDLVYFVEAGFTPGQIWQVLRGSQKGWWPVIQLWWQNNPQEMIRLWAVTAASLFGFEMTPANFEPTLAEIADHAARLSRQQRFPIPPTLAILDYFRRLEMAGLRPQIILE